MLDFMESNSTNKIRIWKITITNSMMKSLRSFKRSSEKGNRRNLKNPEKEKTRAMRRKTKIPMTTLTTTLIISDKFNSKIKENKSNRRNPLQKLNSIIKSTNSKAKFSVKKIGWWREKSKQKSDLRTVFSNTTSNSALALNIPIKSLKNATHNFSNWSRKEFLAICLMTEQDL